MTELDQQAAIRLDRRGLLAGAAAVGVGATALGRTAVAHAASASATARDAAPAQTVVVAMSGPIVALNPDGPGQNNLPSFTAYYGAYDALTDYLWPLHLVDTRRKLQKGQAGLVVPQLAGSWQTAKRGTVYRFNLRSGVKSDFGNTMTAKDVVWSLQKSLAGKSTGAFILSLGGVTSPTQIKAVGDNAVEITLPAANERVLLAVGWGGGGAPVVYDSTEVKKHATKRDPWANKWLNLHTAGYGRYTLTAYTPGGTSATFEARDDYYGPKPQVKRIIQRSVTDSGSRLQLLLTGAAGYAADLSLLQLDQVTKSGRAKVVHVDSSTAAFLPLTQKPPWNDVKIRQAFAKAIPYDEILAAVFRGRAKPYKSVLLPFIPGYTDRFAYKTNIEAAKAVLSGVNTPLTLAYSEGLPIDEQIAILVQQSVKKAGFDLQIQKQPVGEFSTKRFTGGNEFFVDNLATPGIAAPDYYFFLYAGKGGFFNFHKYEDAEFEKAIVGTKSPSAAVRTKAAVDGQRVFMRDLPMIPVAWNGNDYAISKDLSIPYAHTANGLFWWRELRGA